MRALGAVLLALVGCRSAPEPEPVELPPDVLHESALYHGSVLTGAVEPAEEPDEQPFEAPRVRVSTYWLDRWPQVELEALASSARLIVESTGDATRAVPALMPQAGRLRGEPARDLERELQRDATRALVCDEHVFVLPRGISAVVGLRRPILGLGTIVDRVGAEEASVIVARRDDGGLDVATIYQHRADAFPIEGVLAEPLGPPPAEAQLFVLPSPFTDLSVSDDSRVSGAVVYAVESFEPPGRESETAANQVEAFEDALAAAIARRPANRPEARDEAALRGALDALEGERPSRAHLVYLAEATGAGITTDVVLMIGDKGLAEIGRRLAEGLRDRDPADRAALGWSVETTTLQVLAEAASEYGLTDELLSVLVDHTGGPGDEPGLLRDIAASCGSREVFEQELRRVNIDHLSDVDPARRVRAFDWLASHGLAPEGYDPLGTDDERRAAMPEPYR